jgi:antitoxin PrlF
MTTIHSRITSQGQITVPAEVRRKLGVGPGSTLEWSESEQGMLVRRSGQVGTDEIHAALFGKRPLSRDERPVETKTAIERFIRAKHARR